MTALRRLPDAVRGYLFVRMVKLVVVVTEPEHWDQPVPALVAFAIALSLLAAVVFGQQRWAWGLSLLSALVTAVIDVAGEPYWYGFGLDVVLVAILLSPEMREWVGVRIGRRRREQS